MNYIFLKDNKYDILKIKNKINNIKPCIFEWIYLARAKKVLYMLLMYIKVD